MKKKKLGIVVAVLAVLLTIAVAICFFMWLELRQMKWGLAATPREQSTIILEVHMPDF